MKKLLLITLLVISITTLSACSQPTPAPLPTPTSSFSPLILLPTQEPSAQLPTATLPPMPTPTTVPYVPIQAEVTVDNFLLREGPGRMFAAVNMYDIGTRVTLVAREPGNNWVLVQTNDYNSGWMNVDYLSFTGDVTPLPVMHVLNAQILHGRVWNVNKTPATMIGVSIARGKNPGPALEDVSMTNSNGEWYLYLPLDFTGDWVVGTNSYSDKSNAVDASGNLIGKWPGAQLVTLPLQADVSLEFAFLK
jgi:hypothetical protein